MQHMSPIMDRADNRFLDLCRTKARLQSHSNLGGTNSSKGRLSLHSGQTQIQDALETLGIELTFAYSPQAKGRIERSYGTWQDRLLPELRKLDIRSFEKANAYIERQFMPDLGGGAELTPRT